MLTLNYQFYQTFALQFSATRQRIQPGVMRLLPAMLNARRILDLGCGNGELWRRLHQANFEGQYIGLDFSQELLEVAQEGAAAATRPPHFIQADLATPGWGNSLLQTESFDLVLAFAVFHHLPGEHIQKNAFNTIKDLLAPSGLFFHSQWQFLNSPRLRQRIQPWEMIGLRPEDVDPGDYLLDWRQGGNALRYVHHFSPEELDRLAHQSGFIRRETYLSDGEGGRLGLYSIWAIR